MNEQPEALRLADMIERYNAGVPSQAIVEDYSRAAAELRRLHAALAEPEQEPVAWMYHGIRHDDTPHERPSLIWKPEYMDVMSAEKGAKATPLYTTPRQWQGLTRQEFLDATQGLEDLEDCWMAIEAKLKEKNT